MTLSQAFTWRRLGAAMGAWYTYRYSKLTGRYLAPPLPVSLAIEPTTSCNLRCPECPSGLRSFTRPTGKMDTGAFSAILDDVHTHCGWLTLYFQGEPFLNPFIFEMIRDAARRRIYTVISTNAHYLDKERCEQICASGLGKLIISLDGITPETYKKYRIGGELDTVIRGIKEIVRIRRQMKKGPALVLQFLVMQHNQHERGKVKALAQEWGVDEVQFKTVQVYGSDDPNQLVPEDVALSRYSRDEDGKLIPGRSLENHCWKLWSSAVITWDGNVVPCCFDKDADYVMGNAIQTRFRDIWNGEAYHEFRKKLLLGRKEIDICRNCSEGMKVTLSE